MLGSLDMCVTKSELGKLSSALISSENLTLVWFDSPIEGRRPFLSCGGEACSLCAPPLILEPQGPAPCPSCSSQSPSAHLSPNSDISYSPSRRPVHRPGVGFSPPLPIRADTRTTSYTLNLPKASGSAAPAEMRSEMSLRYAFPRDGQYLQQDKNLFLSRINTGGYNV